MRSRIAKHLHGNLVGYVALFVALSGTAWAANGQLAGRNTVGSSAIIDRQVKRADLAANAVTSAKVANGTLSAVDFAPGTLLQGPGGPAGPQGPPGPGGTGGGGGATGPAGGDLTGNYPNPLVAVNAIGSAEVIDGSLTSADVGDESLTGSDITESTLGQVPSSKLGGLGRSAGQGGDCDPESATGFATCASVSLDLPAPARVLLIGRVTGRYEIGANSGHGACHLVASTTGAVGGSVLVRVFRANASGVQFDVGGATPLAAVTPVLGPGPVSFELVCNQLSPGAIFYTSAQIAAVALSGS